MKKYFIFSNIMYIVYIVALLLLTKYVGLEITDIICIAFIVKILEENND